MPQSLSRVYTHITFSTKNRESLIETNIQSRLYNYLGGICKGMGCDPVSVGGYYDHIHILCLLSRNVSQADLLKEIKKESSKWMKQQGSKYNNFYWQNGYGIFSVNPMEADVVIDYIKNQNKHHVNKTFKPICISINDLVHLSF